MANYPHLREANAARQAEWGPAGKVDLSWRINELVGEAGEVCNLLKKVHRERLGIKGSRATKDQLADELADVMICLDLLAMTAEIEGPGSYIAPDDEDPLEDSALPAVGCLLAVLLGSLAQFGTDPDAYRPEDAPRLLSAIRAVGYAISRLAQQEHIDLRNAVAVKFNHTSAVNGFGTRLREYRD